MSEAGFVRRAAQTALIGAILSGPVSVGVVMATHPQPPWQGAELFAASYHPVQILPYALGVFLVVGFGTLIAGLSGRARPPARLRARAAMVFASAFVAMVLTNYAIQLSVVPALLSSSSVGADLAATFTMANPASLGWALEMWGYAALGVATWLVAPVFESSARERVTARLFGAWNVLIVAMLAVTIAVTRASETQEDLSS